ncbi:MAG: hypothetical protein H6716_26660 [Polyangiaceae bacterium]|nr:hypothetical protein [Polyangiaceae bacterium]
MVEPALFGDNVDAHAAYLSTVRGPALKEHLLFVLAADRWADPAYYWWVRAMELCGGPEPLWTFPEIAASWVDTVISRNALTSAVKEWVPQIIRGLGTQTGSETHAIESRISEWLAQRCDAGDAGLVADVVRASDERQSWDLEARPVRETLRPLVDWLLSRGVSELRSKRSAWLLWRILATIHSDRDSRPRLIAVAFRLLLFNPVVFQVVPSGFPFWEAVERADLPSSVVRDLAIHLAEHSPAHRTAWQPLMEVERLPRVGEMLWREVVGGHVEGNAGFAVWFHLAQHAPLPERLERLDASGLKTALKLRLSYDVKVEPDIWAESLTIAAWRIEVGGMDTGVFHPRGFIAHWARDERLVIGVARALRRILMDNEDHELTLAREICSEAEAIDEARLLAIISALPRANIRPVAANATTTTDQIVCDMRQFIDFPWLEPVFGVDIGGLIHGVDRVVLGRLENDRKIRIDGGTIVVDAGDYFEKLCAEGRTIERVRQLALLWFVHELVHVDQGMADLEVVRDLRATGGETNLLHLDLAADHIATLAVSRSRPEWDLIALKDLAGQSLSGYPSSRFHTEASRYRKATRLVSSRADVVARRAEIEISGDGYFFVEFGATGGKLILLNSGPPPRIVGRAANVDSSDVEVLLRAAEPGAELARIDEILKTAVSAIDSSARPPTLR